MATQTPEHNYALFFHRILEFFTTLVVKTIENLEGLKPAEFRKLRQSEIVNGNLVNNLSYVNSDSGISSTSGTRQQIPCKFARCNVM